MRVTVYAYQQCGTCRKALKYLASRQVKHRTIPIRERPPRKPELKAMLRAYGGNLRKLFNTSGREYRRLNLKDRLPGMSESEALGLLAANGDLVRRPFALSKRAGRVGFNEADWKVF